MAIFSTRQSPSSNAQDQTLGRLITAISASHELSARLLAVATALREMPYSAGVIAAAFDKDGTPVSYQSADLSIEAGVDPYAALSSIRHQCIAAAETPCGWTRVDSGAFVSDGCVIAQVLPEAGVHRELAAGVIVVKSCQGGKEGVELPEMPKSIQVLFGNVIAEGVRIQSLQLRSDLHRLAAQEFSGEQLPLYPQRVVAALKEAFSVESATLLVEQFGNLYLSATTDSSLAATALPYAHDRGLTGYSFSHGVAFRQRYASDPPEGLADKNLEAEDRLNQESIARTDQRYRLLLVPMRISADRQMNTRGKAAGVIRLLRREDQPPFTAEDMAILQEFAGILGAMLDASRLLLHFKDIRRTKSEAICISRSNISKSGSRETRFVYANDGAQRLFGKAESAIVGHPAKDLYAGDFEYDRVRYLLNDAIEKKQFEVGPVASRVRGSGGEIRSVDMSFRLLTDPHVRPPLHYAIAIIRDTTEYLTFFNSFGHQLRAPLGAIHHTLLNLQERFSGNRWWLRRLDYCIGTARNVSRLTQNLAHMDKLLRGDSFSFEPVNLAKLAIETKVDFIHLLAEKRLELTIDDSSLDDLRAAREIWGHEDLLRQVLFNLVDNAVKYSSQGTEIRITGFLAGSGGDGVEVTNEGMIIRPEDRETIFLRGHRTARARALTPEGSGLGLWLVQKILQAHGAKIRCDRIVSSDGEERTSFQVIFPYARLTQSTPIRD